MALFAPEISDVKVERQVIDPASVTINSQDLVNLGTSVRTLLEGFQQPEEPVISPESKEPVGYNISPTVPDSGLSIPAQSFLDSIASAESGGDYNIIVGGQRFEDFTEHPNIVGVVTKEGPSTAAGKYQITKQTWNYLKSKYSDLSDFSPQNQDKAAYYLAKERYKINTKGRDLETDLEAGNTSYLRNALQNTWRGILIDKDFESRINRTIQNRKTIIYKPVGFTTIKYTNEGAIRNRPVAPELETKLDIAVSSTLGIGYTVDIFSGGQEGERRTGSIRHNVNEEGKGLAADVKIFDPEGRQVTDTKTLDRVRQFWLDNKYGSVGTYMPDAGIHFDIWTEDKLRPGMALTWSY
jgi:muramidase (phage lysozyme)